MGKMIELRLQDGSIEHVYVSNNPDTVKTQAKEYSQRYGANITPDRLEQARERARKPIYEYSMEGPTSGEIIGGGAYREKRPIEIRAKANITEAEYNRQKERYEKQKAYNKYVSERQLKEDIRRKTGVQYVETLGQARMVKKQNVTPKGRPTVTKYQDPLTRQMVPTVAYVETKRRPQKQFIDSYPKTDFEKATDKAIERRAASEERLGRIHKQAGTLTFAMGKPYEDRSWLGKFSQNVMFVGTGGIFAAGEMTARGTEGAMLWGRSLAADPKNALSTAKDPFFSDREEYINFRKGFNPITPEGAALYTTIGVGSGIYSYGKMKAPVTAPKGMVYDSAVSYRYVDRAYTPFKGKTGKSGGVGVSEMVARDTHTFKDINIQTEPAVSVLRGQKGKISHTQVAIGDNVYSITSRRGGLLTEPKTTITKTTPEYKTLSRPKTLEEYGLEELDSTRLMEIETVKGLTKDKDVMGQVKIYNKRLFKKADFTEVAIDHDLLFMDPKEFKLTVAHEMIHHKDSMNYPVRTELFRRFKLDEPYTSYREGLYGKGKYNFGKTYEDVYTGRYTSTSKTTRFKYGDPGKSSTATNTFKAPQYEQEFISQENVPLGEYDTLNQQTGVLRRADVTKGKAIITRRLNPFQKEIILVEQQKYTRQTAEIKASQNLVTRGQRLSVYDTNTRQGVNNIFEVKGKYPRLIFGQLEKPKDFIISDVRQSKTQSGAYNVENVMFNKVRGPRLIKDNVLTHRQLGRMTREVKFNIEQITNKFPRVSGKKAQWGGFNVEKVLNRPVAVGEQIQPVSHNMGGPLPIVSELPKQNVSITPGVSHASRSNSRSINDSRMSIITQQDQRTNINSAEMNLFKFLPEVKQNERSLSRSRSRQIQDVVLKQRQKTAPVFEMQLTTPQTTKLNTNGIDIPPVIEPIKPRPPPPIIINPFDFDRSITPSIRQSKKLTANQPKQYTPDFASAMLGLRGKKASGFGLKSGLSMRFLT